VDNRNKMNELNTLVDVISQQSLGANFILGIAVGWFGHMFVRRFIFRKLRKII
jgi:hypothetical protein